MYHLHSTVEASGGQDQYYLGPVDLSILLSQNQQIMTFLAVCISPPDKKNKKHQFEQGKSLGKGLKICTYTFLGVPIAMHYLRTLCDKCFLSYDGFS